MTTEPVHTITDEQIAEIEQRVSMGLSHYVHGVSSYAVICLITRLREAEKDAARYLFLRNSGKFSPSAFGDGWSLNCGYTRAQPGQLDQAIDTAMQGEQ